MDDDERSRTRRPTAAAAIEDAMTRIAAAAPHGFVTEVAPGVTAYATGAPMARMNGVVVDDPGALDESAWQRARSLMAASGLPWTVQSFGAGSDPLGAAAEESLDPPESVVTWVLDPAGDIAPVGGVEVAVVSGAADRTGFSRVLGASFGRGPEIGIPLLEAADRDARLRAFVVRGTGSDATEDVLATGYSALDGDVVGVFAIATAVDHRRRGLGEAVTRAVIVDGVGRGATRAVLQASDAGRPLYERLGFRDAGDDIVYRRGPDGVTR